MTWRVSIGRGQRSARAPYHDRGSGASESPSGTPWGELAYDAARGEAVWPLIAARSDDGPLEIRADEAVEGVRIARLLKRLRTASDADLRLVVGGG